jgi:ubiquitin carboxyl-terminal hydrolase L5
VLWFVCGAREAWLTTTFFFAIALCRPVSLPLLLPHSLGHVVASSDRIREVHNSFSKTSPFSLDPSAIPEREKEDAYHFVAYLPVNGVLYELDGLRAAPIMHAAVEGDWLDQARETIEARIATYPPGSVMFNLLAIRSAAVPRLQRQIADPATPAHERLALQDQLDHETQKASQGAVENSLRRHNMLPLVLGLLEALHGSKIKSGCECWVKLTTPSRGHRRRARKGKEERQGKGQEGVGDRSPIQRRVSIISINLNNRQHSP